MLSQAAIKRLIMKWARVNQEAIYKHLETNINPAVEWRQRDIVGVVFDWIGDPEAWEQPDRYLPELYHILNDQLEDFGYFKIGYFTRGRRRDVSGRWY